MRVLGFALVAALAVGCGGGGGGGDDDGQTVDAGDGADAAPPALPVCVAGCTTPADCGTGPAGTFNDADNYACEGNTCRWLGCLSTTECTVTFGTNNYTCEAAFGSPTPTCWQRCSTSTAECATPSNPLVDADNYACEGNKCHWLGCNTTAECTAAQASPDWSCAMLPGATFKTCVRTCSTPADCALASTAYDADNFRCESNLCIYQGCNSTAECATIDPDWVCDE